MRVFTLAVLLGVLGAAAAAKVNIFARAKTGPNGIPDWCTQPLAVRSRALGGDCSFYQQCLEPVYNCGADVNNPNSYPINYGKKYCEGFGRANFLSGKARHWLRITRTCLQMVLLPKINNRVADCRALTDFAFDSHPACYTQPEASICHLLRPAPEDGGVTARARDIATITTVVDAKDLLTVRSARQIGQVIRTCSSQVADYALDRLGDAYRGTVDWLGRLFN